MASLILQAFTCLTQIWFAVSMDLAVATTIIAMGLMGLTVQATTTKNSSIPVISWAPTLTIEDLDLYIVLPPLEVSPKAPNSNLVTNRSIQENFSKDRKTNNQRQLSEIKRVRVWVRRMKWCQVSKAPLSVKLSVSRVETSVNHVSLMCRFVDRKGALSCHWFSSKFQRHIKWKDRVKWRWGRIMRRKDNNMSILEEKIRQFVVKMKKKRWSPLILAWSEERDKAWNLKLKVAIKSKFWKLSWPNRLPRVGQTAIF